jgi:hypothetical protein
MSINGSLQQVSGGIASLAAGLIVVQAADGSIARYDVLGFVWRAPWASPSSSWER